MIQLRKGLGPELTKMQTSPTNLIYLDAAATAPPAPEVLQMMSIAYRDGWANPSSMHGPGIKAVELLERSRQTIAHLLGATPNELILCSGGTESIHLALLGTAVSLPVGQLVISAVEHPAVTGAAKQLSKWGWNIKIWPVDSQGQIKLSYLDELLSPPTRMVSIVWGQSEVGTLQPIEQVGQKCHERGIIFHTDAVQVMGHKIIEWSNLPVDLLSFSAHKLHGPRGIGGLLKRSMFPCQPQINGGGQEHGLRSGTQSVALAVGFATALDIVVNRLQNKETYNPIELWRNWLLYELLLLPGIELTGHPYLRLPHHLSILIKDNNGKSFEGNRLAKVLANQGLAISNGTACHSGTANYSHTLRTMGYSERDASAGLRFTLGPWHHPDALMKIPLLIKNSIIESK